VKLLDTNVLVRYIVQPVAGQDATQVRYSTDIIEGAEPFTTTDAVIAEVVYVLTSKRLYNLVRSEVRNRLETILSSSNCAMQNARSLIAALDIWERDSRVSFVDAYLAALSRAESLDLVTFDTALARAAGTQRWDLRSTGDAPNPTVEMP
jgi:predicted nucleic acid-binding protein